MPYRFDEHISSQSAQIDFARGHYNNVTPVHLFGFNRTVATAFETIMNDGGGVYSFPSTGLIMSLVSSAADTCDVTLVGLDASYAPLVETVTLTGTTPVTTSSAFFRINQAYVSSGTQSGNVTVSNGGTTYSYIEAAAGVASNATYTTGANQKLYITNVNFTSGTVNPNKYLTGRVRQKTNGGSVAHFWQATWSISQLDFKVPIPYAVPPMTDFSFEAKSSSGENEIAVYVNAFMVDNE